MALILGTTREGRKSESVARYIFEKLKVRSDIEIKFVDPREYKLELNNDGKRDLPDFQKIVEESDAFLVVSPEYNHSYPGTLKFLLDQVRPISYARKAAAICGVSNGTIGGARMIEHVASLFHDLGMSQIKNDLLVKEVGETFVSTEKFDELLTNFLDELLWLSKSLKWGRENL